jgi:molybdopterin-containing oxidoreductase family membrane subunit
MSTTFAPYAPPPLIHFRRRPSNQAIAMMILGAISFAIAAPYVLWQLWAEGHAAFNTSSDIAWGAPIAFYLFFLLTSSGMSILASLDSVFGMQLFYPVAKRMVFLSICCLIAGFTILALEIGHPFRMLWALPFSLQYHSPMWWMGVFYTLDLILLIAKFYLMHRARWNDHITHWVSIVSFVVSVAAPGTLGLVFGMMAMRQAWYSPIMPMYFVLLGFISGIAFLMFFASILPHDLTKDLTHAMKRLFSETLPRLFFITLLAVIGMRFGQIITNLWSSYDGMDAHWYALNSGLFWVEITLGLIFPAALMAFDNLRRQRLVQAVAGLAYMIGMFTGRLEFLINGQIVPLFKGSWAGYVDYWPSATEWMLVPVGVGVFLMLYGAGCWLFMLWDAPRRSHVASHAEATT